MIHSAISTVRLAAKIRSVLLDFIILKSGQMNERHNHYDVIDIAIKIFDSDQNKPSRNF